MDRVMITGGAGFIGSHLALHLKNAGNEVFVVDDLSRSTVGNHARLVQSKIEIFETNILSSELKDVMRKVEPDVVVHAAALTDVLESTDNPKTYHYVNSRGTFKVLDAALHAGVEQAVYLSSAAVYGNPKYVPIDEKHSTEPISVYGKSKLNGEKHARLIGESWGLVTFIPRIFNVYGVGQNPSYSGVISKFVDAHKKKEHLIVNGDGKQTRDFVNVKDVVSAVELGIKKRLDLTLNIGSGKETSIRELAETITRAGDGAAKIKHVNSSAEEIRNSFADIRAARREGWSPNVKLEDGIRELMAG